jgi:hypothetical protein
MWVLSEGLAVKTCKIKGEKGNMGTPGRLAATALSLFAAPLLLAQTAATGALTGTVTDATGAVVPNVSVTLTSLDTAQVRNTTTGGDGTYRFNLLPPANYKVAFAASGFKQVEVPSVTVAVTETPVFNQSLEVGTQTEQVTVEANTEAIQTASSALGTVVESKAATSLPLTTRNYTNLLGLSAGVNASVANATSLGRGNMEFAVNGASTAQNTFLMDGVSIVNAGSSGVATENNQYATFGVPNPDTLAEFKIQTSLYDAGYGRNPGANVNVITKSGTNEFHGTAFEFFRNTDLNANDFFRNRTCGITPSVCAEAGGNKLVFNQNQFGGVLGGPVKKDKFFFFTSYQQTWQKNGIASQGYSSTTLPPLPQGNRNTPAWQAALGAMYCPTQPAGTKALPAATVGTVACDGSNINPIAIKYLTATLSNGSYVMPGSTTGANQPISYSVPAYDREYQGMLNLDYLLDSKNTLSAKYYRSVEPQSYAFGAAVPGTPGDNDFGYHTGVLKLTTIISSSMVNEARVSFQRTLGDPYYHPPTSLYASNIYGVQGGCNLLGCAEPYSPDVSLSSAGFYSSSQAGSNETAVNFQYQIADQVSWTHGKHSVRFGFEVERAKWNYIFKGLETGIMSFNTVADFLLGQSGNIANTSNYSVRGGPDGIIHAYLMRNANAFVQDDIKVNQRLTVNVGVRWEYDGQLADKYGNMTNSFPFLIAQAPAPVTTQLPTPGIYSVPAGASYVGWVVPANFSVSTWGTPPSGVQTLSHDISTQNGTPLTNFAPRLGFAYQPTGNNKLVVRGGAGFFYDRVPGGNLIHGASQNPPFADTLDQSGVANSFSTEAVPFQSTPLGTFPARWVNFTPGLSAYDQSSSLTITGIYPQFVTPLVYSWNLNVQYQLAPTWVLEVGYVGSRGEHQNFCVTCQVNEALLATPSTPINGQTTSTTSNVLLRVPLLGLGATGGQFAQTNGDYKSNSLQVTLRKQLSHGLTMQAAYTWVRAFAAQDSSGDPNNQAQQYGLNPGYRPQRVTINYSYNIPGADLKALNGAAGKILGGWTLSGVTTIQDGDPLTCTDNRGGAIFGQNSGGALSRCQMAAGETYANIDSSGGIEARLGGASGGCGYFACTTPAAGGTAATASGFTAFTPIPNVAGTNGTGWGNSGLGTFMGPGQFNFDLTLGKTTRVGGIHENATLQFRAEFFNLFNHPQFSNPAVAFNSASSFGQITSASVNPRLVQLALKYVF